MKRLRITVDVERDADTTRMFVGTKGVQRTEFVLSNAAVDDGMLATVALPVVRTALTDAVLPGGRLA